MISEKIIELRKQGLTIAKISQQLHVTKYRILKTINYEQWVKSYGHHLKSSKVVRKTDAQIKQTKSKTNINIAKDWILKHYELTESYKKNILDIYKSYEYFIFNVYNLKNKTNLDTLSTQKFRKIMVDCGFSCNRKSSHKIVEMIFNCCKKANC